MQRKDRVERTGIFKFPTNEAVKVTKLGLEGDVIVDKKHHGGPDQAVYVYGAADYEWWSKELGREIAPGTFGENLTIGELESAQFNIGDYLYVGEVTLQVTAPRIPCGTFATRMDDPQWVKRFRHAERPGLYCRVIQEGLRKSRRRCFDGKLYVAKQFPFSRCSATFTIRIKAKRPYAITSMRRSRSVPAGILKKSCKLGYQPKHSAWRDLLIKSEPGLAICSNESLALDLTSNFPDCIFRNNVL